MDAYQNHQSGNFYELIIFSDCEGTIGCEVSKKIYSDFERFQEKANEHPDASFQRLYSHFKHAFLFASDNGAVQFM
jgi:hypothetical protein